MDLQRGHPKFGARPSWDPYFFEKRRFLERNLIPALKKSQSNLGCPLWRSTWGGFFHLCLYSFIDINFLQSCSSLKMTQSSLYQYHQYAWRNHQNWFFVDFSFPVFFRVFLFLAYFFQIYFNIFSIFFEKQLSFRFQFSLGEFNFLRTFFNFW